MADSKPESVPVLPWMRDPVHIDEVDTCPLHLLPGLDRRLEAALKLMGIQSLFRVQVAVWQEIMGFGAFERDICVNSPTGSGKTLAYALPIVQLLSTRKIKCLRALVVVPTRDLALQVKEVFTAIAPAVGLHVGLAIGQSSIADEILQLIKRPKLGMTSPFDPEDLPMELESAVDILVATPGRLMDHINTTKGFSLKHLCYLGINPLKTNFTPKVLSTYLRVQQNVIDAHLGRWVEMSGPDEPIKLRNIETFETAQAQNPIRQRPREMIRRNIETYKIPARANAAWYLAVQLVTSQIDIDPSSHIVRKT